MALTVPTLPLTTLPPNAKSPVRSRGEPSAGHKHRKQAVGELSVALSSSQQHQGHAWTRLKLGFGWEVLRGLLGAPTPVLNLLFLWSPYSVLAKMAHTSQLGATTVRGQQGWEEPQKEKAGRRRSVAVEEVGRRGNVGNS